ncbi:hypothetical protein K458DRAFT_366768 [Lentithecium fluviatile CBS 122367]|uniref:SnoaL-like domain-containing protein n=1 Tax=Lentithecium fluviatile CBS 122367 TaxID=1168545 RepID=A0A6G1J2G5_9PLEO|nr:hypothetical protein K458DRAFT_366768 [Lentithecium fluviatile CBS 122367]
MSSLQISNPELRLATAALAALAAILPAYYYLRGSKRQEDTPHVKTFHKYLAAYSTLRPAALGANASSTFAHNILPLASRLPSRPLSSFQQHAVMIFSLFKSFSMIPQSNSEGEAVHFSKETNTVVAHCKMGGTVNGEDKKGKQLVEAGYREWWTECVLFVRMSEDGRMVEEVSEFVDSKKAEELQIRLSGVLSG